MNTKYILDVARWRSGSIGVWGAVPPFYDTTNGPTEKGIHVHTRSSQAGIKEIDSTYSNVEIRNWDDDEGPFLVSASSAVHYMVAAILGLSTRVIRCPRCKQPHLDEGWLSVHPHREHLCADCDTVFIDKELGIGNPVRALSAGLESRSGYDKTDIVKSLEQPHYPGGIRLWASNPALYWRNQPAENRGIHVHAFDEEGEIVEDETFSRVEVDGIELDAEVFRFYMAQSSLPFLEGRVVDIVCSVCGTSHFDRGVEAISPHSQHVCDRCGERIVEKGELRPSIGNPAVGVLTRLRNR